MAVPLLNARLDAAAIAAAANAGSQPAAIVCNAHITGLAVARTLAARGVPVIGLDRDPAGVGLASNALAAAAVCHDPIGAEADFIADLQAIGDHLDRPAVLFGCMDEWVLAISAHRAALADRFVIPFADDAIVRRILDKSTLYQAAREAGIPIPRTSDTRQVGDAEAMTEVGLPCVLKPAAKRPFYDAIGANLFVVETPAEFTARRQQGDAFGMLAQERIPATADDYVTVGLAVGPDGQALGSYVGQRLEIAPAGFGTTCLARGVDLPELEAQAIAIVQRLGYWGIAEVEFLRDPRDGEFKLLDLNTRPWKWIGLPIAAGVDLPGLLYAAALDRPAAIPERRPDLMWTSLKDYVPLKARGEAMQPGDPIGRERWLQLIAGAPEAKAIDAILDRNDPEPAYRALQGVFGLHHYSCPC